MKEKSYLNRPYDPEILECSLPKYLEDDIKALKKGYEEKTLHLDCLFNEVEGSIDSAYYDGTITDTQKDYLYDMYVYGEYWRDK